MKTRSRSFSVVILLLTSCPVFLQAQDPFEIPVYEYDTVPKGMWNLETRLNYIGSGTSFDGPVSQQTTSLISPLN